MRKLFFGIAMLAGAMMTAGLADAQRFVVPNKSKLPDLAIPNVYWGGDVLYVPVQNKGVTLPAKCKLRVTMFRKINGFYQVVSTGISDVPSISPGQFTSVKVQMNQQVVNCKIIIMVDYQNVVAEVDEKNNFYETSFK
jgi:hypothetical protein